jgi:hypothetical protein
VSPNILFSDKKDKNNHIHYHHFPHQIATIQNTSIPLQPACKTKRYTAQSVKQKELRICFQSKRQGLELTFDKENLLQTLPLIKNHKFYQKPNVRTPNQTST